MRVAQAIAKLDNYNPNTEIRTKNIFSVAQKVLPIDNIVGHRDGEVCVLEAGNTFVESMLIWEVLEKLKTFPRDAKLKVKYQFADELRFLDVFDINLDCTDLYFEAREKICAA